MVHSNPPAPPAPSGAGQPAAALSRRRLIGVGAAGISALLIPAVTAATASAATSSTTGTAAPRVNQGSNGPTLTVAAGQTYTVSATTRLSELDLAAGGVIQAPSGYSLTLTVDGVDTGEALTATGGADTAITAGRYRGDVVLTVTAAHGVAFGGLTFPFRQALYVDASGVSDTESVLAAVQGGRVTSAGAHDIRIRSTGEAFNGVYTAGGSYELRDPDIAFDGNGRCDFVGYGAAVVGDGATLVVDGARIRNRGAVRTAVIATGGANVVVKNSQISVANGTLPADYVSTVNTTLMEDAPWMLGISGNVRATNLLGTKTQASYINTSVSSEGWGILSTDNGQNGVLTAVNCELTTTGTDGYGTYAIGDATEWLLGCRMNVGTYATINRGGAVHYGDSTRAKLEELNTSLGLGLTRGELEAIPQRSTHVDSRRWGFMWHGAGTLEISGGTVVDSALSTFLNKGQTVGITVDGTGGARLNPGNGILMQIMENDDPGPVMVGGSLVNRGVYTEPATAPVKDASFDVTTVNSTDSVAAFTGATLRGDFYNGIRGGASSGGGPGPAAPAGMNMVLAFDATRVEGVITASTTKHAVSSIDYTRYRQLGMVTNTPGPAVNNGVIVQLGAGSRWQVTGTSYLTSLTIDATASVTAPRGRTLTFTVDGTATVPTPGSTYTGALVLSVS